MHSKWSEENEKIKLDLLNMNELKKYFKSIEASKLRPLTNHWIAIQF
jgi:hypothetical protein